MIPVIVLAVASVLPHPTGNFALGGVLGDMARSHAYHTQTELETWLEEWRAEAEHETVGLHRTQPQLLAALADMERRHGPAPTWDNPPSPPKTQTPAAASRSYSSGVEQWRGLVSQHFGSETDTALRVMRCESRGDPSAQNSRSSAAGLFQILRKTWAAFSPYPWSDRYHPGANVATAKRIRDGQGWGAWSCY